MTLHEAAQVVGIMSEADAGCPVCTAELFKLFMEKFPQFKIEVLDGDDIRVFEGTTVEAVS